MSDIHHAIDNDNHHQLQLLLNMGHRVKDRVENGKSLMHLTAYWNSIKCAQVLLKNGADVDPELENDGGTPLFIAILRSKREISEWLIENNANVNAAYHRFPPVFDYQMESILILAIKNNMYDTAKLLIEKGAIVDHLVENTTALMEAVKVRSMNFVNLLIENKVVDIYNHMGENARKLARKSGYTEIMEVLKLADTDPYKFSSSRRLKRHTC